MYRAAHFRKGSPCPPTLTLALPSELGAPTATPCAAAACAQLCKPPPPAPNARETRTQVMPSALSGLWDVLIFADERGWPVSSVNSQYLKGKTCHPASPRPTTCLSPRGRAAQAWSLAPPWLVLWLSPPPSVRRSSLCWGWTWSMGQGVVHPSSFSQDVRKTHLGQAPRPAHIRASQTGLDWLPPALLGCSRQKHVVPLTQQRQGCLAETWPFLLGWAPSRPISLPLPTPEHGEPLVAENSILA